MKVILIGVGKYTEETLRAITQFSEVLVIEREKEKLDVLSLSLKEFKNVSLVSGSATDIELWKGINIEEFDAVISFLRKDLTVDVAKLLRKVFNFRKLFIYVAREKIEEKYVKDLKIEVVYVPEILGLILKNLLIGHGLVRYPVGIGLGKGEVAEITISETSPLVGVRISELRRKDLRIVQVYRKGEVILPKPSFRLNIGDSVLIAGKPGEVELFVNTVVKGIPTFPLKWGNEGSFCKVDERIEEFEYIKSKLKTKSWKGDCFPDEETGVIVFGKKKEGILGRNYLKDAFTKLQVPSFFLKGSFPYESILVSANTDVLGDLLPNAVDVSRVFKAKLHICFVKSAFSEEESEIINKLKDFVKKGKKLANIEINLLIREGNPVRETLKILREGFNLLIVGYTFGYTGSLLNPYVPYILAKRSPITTLLIPEVIS